MLDYVFIMLYPIVVSVGYYMYDLSWLSLLSISLLVTSVADYLIHLTRHALLMATGVRPPGPYPLPLAGSLPSLIKDIGPDGQPRIHVGLHKVATAYGSTSGIAGLWMGSYYTAVITKPKLAYEAFVTNGRFTSDRAPMQSHGGHHVPSMYIATRDGKGIAMSTGEYWRKVRGALVGNITCKAVAEKNVRIVEEEINSVVWAIRERADRNEPIRKLTAQLKRESMNVVMRMLFSRRFGATLPKRFEELRGAIEFIFKNLSSGNPGDMIPLLRVFPTKMLRDMRRVVKRRDEVLAEMIEEHRQGFDPSKPPRDFVDRLFADKTLSDDERHVVIWDIIFGGTDTTATTNEWLIYFMINYPDVQRKVHAELDAVIGTDRLPTLQDRPKLTYFFAVLKEVMRMRIVSPVLAPHYCSEDIKVGGYVLPRGTAIYLHAWAMAKDPELWKDPETFNPDRWLKHPRNDGLSFHGFEKRKSIEHYKFIPFSMGPRTCPGYSFAKVTLFLQAAALMQCFEWSSPKAPLDLTECWGLTIMPDRHASRGHVFAKPRAAAKCARPLEGDEVSS